MPEERVYVLCTRCAHLVPTGQFIDPDVLPSKIDRLSENRTLCQVCGNWVVWSKTKVWPASVVLQRYGKLPESE